MYKGLKSRKGITLVALVITIIILIILAGISISALSGSGLFARANDAKIETKMSEIEEFATMKIYELYIENANNMDAVNDATITTALKAELEAEGYVTKDANTTSEKVNGLKIQDSTGKNNFESISLLQQKNTTIKVDLDITSQAKTYVKIYDNWYELIINDKTVKISREKHDEPVDSENKENTYEIKLTPPTSGITMAAGETPITSETGITPGALITIKSGNDIGIFAFNVKETTSSVTKNVNVEVTADPKYATDLSIAVEGGKDAEVARGKTLQLVATKTPATSTDTVSWSIKSGSATIDSTGLVTANSDAEVESKIIVSATCNRKDGTTTTVGEKTFEITVKKKIITLTAQQIAADPKSYYGKKVLNYKASDSDPNTYRIFYVSTTDNEFGDPRYTIYLKSDVKNTSFFIDTKYSQDTKVKEMNPLWAIQRGTATWNDNEKAAAYVCSPVTSSSSTLPWKEYYNSSYANYVIGGPSLEMYVKSYNQTHDKDSNSNDALGCQYQENDVPGYAYKVYGTVQNNGWNTGLYTIDYSKTYNSMYCGFDGVKANTRWYIASPLSKDSTYVCYVSDSGGYLGGMAYPNSSNLIALVSLKSNFQPQIEE